MCASMLTRPRVALLASAIATWLGVAAARGERRGTDDLARDLLQTRGVVAERTGLVLDPRNERIRFAAVAVLAFLVLAWALPRARR